MADLLKLGRSVLQKQPFSAHLGAELVLFETGRAVGQGTIVVLNSSE